MSLTVNLSPTSRVLVGNPVKLSIHSDSLATYSIIDAETTLFTGSGEGHFFIYIQEILATAIAPVPAYNDSPDVLIPLPKLTKEVTIQVRNASGESQSLPLNIFLGGVSKRMLRQLHDQNKSIFLVKLMNPEGNFFLTTRTESRFIALKETEINPLYFIYPDGGNLKIVSDGIETQLPGTPGHPYALNLYRLRKQLFTSHHKLLSTFDVYVGTHKACTIILTPGSISRERYLLEFLNSYGAYERIEVTGIGQIKHEAKENKPYFSYDEIVDDYVESWERTEGKSKMTVETGHRTPEELAHLIDLLASDEVRILGVAGRNIRVHPMADNLVQAARATEPESIKLTLRFADTEQRHSSPITEEHFGNPRIHTHQFDKHFN